MITVPRTLLIAEVSALLMLSAGCSSQNSSAEVMVVEGCMVSIKGLTTIQATDVTKTWEFRENCNIDTDSTLNRE
jgi:hypothetical protein